MNGGVKDEAGPLWIMMENFFESWPVKPKWVLLAVLVIFLIAATVSYIVASTKRRNRSAGNVQDGKP
jgi:hypothetical protein